ncbi:hypothetical protein [Methylobacterium sp. J-076]|nr:hypothetical protein [Methylobacterium sp. J-076]MCJ2012899.1 hypothetical protein [Methylobacterium sp. J-076]
MRIRKEATYDGVWTLFVGEHLCISDLSEAQADALAAAFASLAHGE